MRSQIINSSTQPAHLPGLSSVGGDMRKAMNLQASDKPLRTEQG